MNARTITEAVLAGLLGLAVLVAWTEAASRWPRAEMAALTFFLVLLGGLLAVAIHNAWTDTPARYNDRERS